MNFIQKRVDVAITKLMDDNKELVREQCKELVREQCKAFIGDALRETADFAYPDDEDFYYMRLSTHTVKGQFKMLLKEISDAQYKDMHIKILSSALNQIKENIEGEEFIDRIVERIQKKQLK